MSENPRDYVATLSEEDFKALSLAVRERECREALGYGTFAEASSAYVTDPACVSCGSTGALRNGFTRAGVQRYRCRACGAGFNALSGTAIAGMRSDFPSFADFVRLMSFNVPLDCVAEMCGITHTLAWEWRHRVFASVSSYQDSIMLRDKVWVDETFVDDTDLTPFRGARRSQGLSKEKACICVAIDVHKNVVAKWAGNGKPSGKRVRDALGRNIAKGSTIVGDREKAHNALVEAVGGEHVAYKADASDPDYLEGLAMANNLCSWIKRYLRRHAGMEMRYLQDYLNWYVYLFRVNQARDKWPRTQRIIRHLMLTRVQAREDSLEAI